MILQADHVSFKYGKREVLREFSYTFGTGLYGLLGPNGAGKTTLLKLLATAAQPDAGSILMDEHDMSIRRERMRARSRIGYLPQRFELMRGSTLLHNVQYATWLHGGSWQQAGAEAADTLTMVGLAGHERVLVKNLSGGMRQRVGIACALAAHPDLLLLDEPTVGLDPLQRVDLRRVLESYARLHTVILSTHLVEDVVAMSKSILVIDRGRLLFDGNADELAALGRQELGTESTQDALVTVWEAGYRELVGQGLRHA